MAKILRKPEVLNRTGLSHVTIWRLEKKGDFPQRVKLGARAVGWIESDIEKWIETRRAAA